MKGFLLFLLTFGLVYGLAPWLAYQVFHAAFPRHEVAAGLIAIWLAYWLLRRWFGEKFPHV